MSFLSTSPIIIPVKPPAVIPPTRFLGLNEMYCRAANPDIKVYPALSDRERFSEDLGPVANILNQRYDHRKTETARVMVYIKAPSTPIVLPPSLSQFEEFVAVAARARYGDHLIDNFGDYVALNVVQGNVEPGRYLTFSGAHFDAEYEPILRQEYDWNRQVFLVSDECPTIFYPDGCNILPALKYVFQNSTQQEIATHINPKVDQAADVLFQDNVNRAGARMLEPYQVVAYDPFTPHEAQTVECRCFRTLAALVFHQGPLSKEDFLDPEVNSDVLRAYMRNPEKFTAHARVLSL